MFYQLERYGRNIAIRDDLGHVVTYTQLAALADRWAKQIGPGPAEGGSKKLVFMRCRNHFAIVTAYLGCFRHGHVALLISDGVEVKLLDNLLESYKPDFIFEPVAHKTPQAQSKSSTESSSGQSSKQTQAVDPEQELWSFITDSYQLVRCDTVDEGCSIHPDLALLLSTSGSTGSPKLVRLTAQNIQSNTESIVAYLGLTSQERPITSLPLNYGYGLSIINTHLEVGATILLTAEPIVQARFWEFFKEQKATSFAGVPYSYKLLKMLRIMQQPLPSLKTLTQSGAILTSKMFHEIMDFCQRNGTRLILMYGQTETSTRMSFVPWEMLPQKEGSAGIAIQNGRFELLDERGNEITQPNVVGDLIYYGPSVCMGLAQCRADLAQGDINHGRIETGDLGYFDQDGYLFITGRRKRFIKLYGSRFSLQECEFILREHGFECLALGQDEDLWLALIIDPNAALTKEQQIAKLHDFMVVTFHLHGSMFKIRAIAEKDVPYNEFGKVQYQRLAKVFEE